MNNENQGKKEIEGIFLIRYIQISTIRSIHTCNQIIIKKILYNNDCNCNMNNLITKKNHIYVFRSTFNPPIKNIRCIISCLINADERNPETDPISSNSARGRNREFGGVVSRVCDKAISDDQDRNSVVSFRSPESRCC